MEFNNTEYIQDIKLQIIGLFHGKKKRPLTARAISASLSLPLDGVTRACGELLFEGLLYEAKGARFAPPEAFGLFLATLTATKRLSYFITPPGSDERLPIPRAKTLGAWHGDLVLAGTERRGRSGERDAHVVKIIRRASSSLSGRVFFDEKGECFAEPLDMRLCEHIWLPPGEIGEAREGDIALIEVLRFPASFKEAATGRVLRVLGGDGSREAYIEAALLRHGVQRGFDPGAAREASKAPQKISETDASGRLDLRDRAALTVDGEDARDIDDALSVWREGEHLRLGVHIADVSSYVAPGSALDAEAFARGTSVYFAGGVEPMLPVELSNGICSLNEGEDRLCLSVFIDFDENFNIKGEDFQRTVIRSRLRAAYSGVNALYSGAEPDENYGDFKNELFLLRSIAGGLRRARMARGALDIRSSEAQITLDASGAPTDIAARSQGEAENVIEECMIAANEAVARFLSASQTSAVFRTHGEPGESEAASLASALSAFGYLPEGAPSERDFSRALDFFRGSPLEGVTAQIVTRHLARARYSPENSGHFGLKSESYCHFTAPIRRYPDLLVHRALTAALSGEQAFSFAEAARCSVHCSDREWEAACAEREIDKLYKAEYMSARVGEEFDGVISGIQTYGFFVRLPSTVEGLVPLSLLDDFFVPDGDMRVLKGLRTDAEFRLGDPIRVVCAGAYIETGEIDFVPAGTGNDKMTDSVG